MRKGCLQTCISNWQTHQYLHYNSCHLCKCSIPYSQALRIRPICSNSVNFDQRVNDLNNFVVNQGYRENEVQQQTDRATSVDGDHLFKLQAMTEPTLESIQLVATYHPELPKLRCILDQHLPVLHVSPRPSKIVPCPPLWHIATFRILKISWWGLICIHHGRPTRAIVSVAYPIAKHVNISER